jgi:hypothetical protein
VSAPATYRSGTETNTLRLPGGTPIFEVSRQQFMKYPGQELYVPDNNHMKSSLRLQTKNTIEFTSLL